VGDPQHLRSLVLLVFACCVYLFARLALLTAGVVAMVGGVGKPPAGSEPPWYKFYERGALMLSSFIGGIALLFLLAVYYRLHHTFTNTGVDIDQCGVEDKVIGSKVSMHSDMGTAWTFFAVGGGLPDVATHGLYITLEGDGGTKNVPACLVAGVDAMGKHAYSMPIKYGALLLLLLEGLYAAAMIGVSLYYPPSQSGSRQDGAETTYGGYGGDFDRTRRAAPAPVGERVSLLKLV
jgi:hypothetical protein